jgi:nucleoprotein TPR
MHNYRFQQSTLRENSMELESAKKLLSEKEVVIKNLEDKLSICQSELDSKEKKLNDVEVRMIQIFNTNISTILLYL